MVTVNFTVEGDLELDKFKAWLAELLWEEKGNDIFRMKGIISIKDEQNKFALQVRTCTPPTHTPHED